MTVKAMKQRRKAVRARVSIGLASNRGEGGGEDDDKGESEKHCLCSVRCEPLECDSM